MELFGMKVKPMTLEEWVKSRLDISKCKLVKSEDKGINATTFVIGIHDPLSNEVYVITDYEEALK